MLSTVFVVFIATILATVSAEISTEEAESLYAKALEVCAQSQYDSMSTAVAQFDEQFEQRPRIHVMFAVSACTFVCLLREPTF